MSPGLTARVFLCALSGSERLTRSTCFALRPLAMRRHSSISSCYNAFMLDILSNPVFLAIASPLFATLALLGPKVLSLIKNKLIREALARVGVLAYQAMLAVGREFVDAIKEGRADGKLTADEKQEAMDRAIVKLRSYASLDILAKLIGVGAAEEYARDAIEQKLQEHKDMEFDPLDESPQS